MFGFLGDEDEFLKVLGRDIGEEGVSEHIFRQLV
jgi:hypothetical protein